MAIKMICLIAFFLSAYCMLAEAASGIVWGPGGNSTCDMRFQDDTNKKACAQWPAPSLDGNTGYMRMFRLKTAYKEDYETLGPDTTYRCPNLQNYYKSFGGTAPLNCPNFDCYQYLVGERILYGTFSLFTKTDQLVTKGKFGPLFVRTPVNQSWADKVPGFDKFESNLYTYFNFFVPHLRRNFNDPAGDYDITLQEWLTPAGKRNFKASSTLSVICRDKEKNCEPPISPPSTESYLIGYTPLARGTSYDMKPEINKAWINIETFHLDLKHWVPSDASTAEKAGMNDYIYSILQGGLPEFRTGQHICRYPKVQFVLYDSNPAPHEDTDPTRWNRKNGEVRAVFAHFSVNMAVGQQNVAPFISTSYLIKSWDITLDSSNWKEEQLRFLEAWQKSPPPMGLDDRDTVWYKRWTKVTGMSVAFTFCACKNMGMGSSQYDDPIYGCIDYLHTLVEIKDRDWLA